MSSENEDSGGETAEARHSLSHERHKVRATLLSPSQLDQEYVYNLQSTEGVADLYDIESSANEWD